MWVIVYMCALVSAALAQSTSNSLTVNTTQGAVIGGKAEDGNYYGFYGLFYGGTTAGSNRFKAPTPPPAYPGTYHATHNTNVMCAQPSSTGIIGDENCLTLNIFTSNVTTPKPVLVWLQSEQYTTSGPQLYSYQRLVSEGIVVVTLNHRLSIFGFLCLGVSQAPGNAGLKDVIQGLKWIQENIAGFGGDRNNVVLFGHGSGAAMVDLITMSPLSENLVHKAIAQSGSALAPWAVAYDPIGSAHNLGMRLGYDMKSNTELAELLADTDINLLASVLDEPTFPNNTAMFAPCIENRNLNSSDTFLSDAPLNLLRSGNFRQIPYIAGYTNREGTLRAAEAVFFRWLERMQANFTEFFPVDLDIARNITISNAVREYYFSQSAINMETIEDYLDYQGDILILISVIRGAWERALTSTADVRLYEFAYRGTRNSFWSYPSIPLNGVKHGGVLNYLLNFDLLPEAEGVMTSLIRRYASFLNTGVPTENSMVDWLPINSSTYNYFYYTGDRTTSDTTFTEARVNPHQQRMAFWNRLYSEYYKSPTPVSSAEKILSFIFTIFMCQLFVQLFH